MQKPDRDPLEPKPGDLAVTALYTSQAWVWAGLEGADLFESVASRRVFSVVNTVLWIAGWLRRGPSLPDSLKARHEMLDLLVGDAGQVLELAAGLSRRGAALSADGRHYVEVDLPHVIAHKEALLARSEAGREVLARPTLVRVAGDATTLDLAALVTPGPLTLVAEGLLMYLEAADQRALWQRLADLLRGRSSSQLLFDLTPPTEEPARGFIGRLLDWAMKRFTGGRGLVRDARTRSDLVRELQQAGFADVACLEPADLPIPTPRRPTQVVIFCCRV